MTRLRRKIEADPKYPRHLRTVRGTGYVLVPD
jgi:two-component system phosphate regulon response regulator OmpR